MAPILLKRTPVTQRLDQAGIMVEKSVWSSYNLGYYTHNLLPADRKPLDTLDYVPPLQYFCLKTLYPNVDSIEMGGLSRFPFHPDIHTAWLKGLIPFYTPDMHNEDLKYVDPRLWGTLIQLYLMLPPCFHTYTLPLSDIHLSQLQAIRSTPDFTLITVLDLSSRPELTDETIGELKPLTNLCVLDLSLTGVGSWGVKKLSMCLVRNQGGRIGPWGLRIWSLRGCGNVDDTVKDALARFPLLSAVDLRDTSVSPFSHFPGYTSKPPSTHTTFYHPNPPLSWMDGLCGSFPDCRIFQSSAKNSIYILHINKLQYPKIFPPNRFHDKTNQMRPTEQHSDVLAFFSNGRNGLYKAHDLSRESQQEGSITRRLSGKARKVVQRHHAYGPEDTYDCGYMGGVGVYEHDEFSDHGSWCDDTSKYGHSDCDRTDDKHSCRCYWRDEMSEDGHSDRDQSDDDRSDSDVSEHQVLFNTGGTDRLFDPNMSQGYSMSERELFGPYNEVAALVAERSAAEQKAGRFYDRPDFPELGWAHRLLIKQNDRITSVPTETGESHGPAEQILPPSRQWSQMFFRKPPAYDSISHDGDHDTGHSYMKKPDETTVAKKRRTGVRSGGVPEALLHRQATEGQSIGRTATMVECSQSAESLSTRTGGDLHSSPRVSMNPFLAKMKRPKQSPSTSELDFPSIPHCWNETQSCSTMQPRTASRSQPQPKTSLDPVKFTLPSRNGSYTVQPENKGSVSKKTNQTSQDLKEKVVKTKQRKVKQTFDMRAWATQNR